MSTLPGFTIGETLIMAAAYYHSKDGVLDFEKLQKHIGSASVTSVRVRLNAVRRKTIDLDNLPEVSDAPVGGVSKKSPHKVNTGAPKKATPAKPRAKRGAKGKTSPMATLASDSAEDGSVEVTESAEGQGYDTTTVNDVKMEDDEQTD